MKYSLTAILLVMMAGAFAMPINASGVNCTTAAPASYICDGPIYFANPVYGTFISSGNLTTDTGILNQTGFENLTLTFHERLSTSPTVYNATPAYTCFAPKDNRTRCDGMYLISGAELNSTFDPVEGKVYLLRMHVQGTQTMSGTFGWTWSIPSPPPYSPPPCARDPITYPNGCIYVPPGNPQP